MNRWLQGCLGVVLLAAAVACLALADTLLRVGSAAEAMRNTANAVKVRVESDDVTALIGNATAVSHHAYTSLDEADKASKAATRAASKTVDTQSELIALIRSTDAAMNGKDGVLPTLAEQTRKNGSDLNDGIRSMNGAMGTIGTSGSEAIVELRDTIHDVGVLANDPNIRATLKNTAASAENVNAATKEMNAMLFDLRHPEKPGKFVRALSIFLQLLRSGAMAGQTAGLAR